MVSGFLVKAGVTVWIRVMLYKAMVQAVLLYRSKSWVIAGVMMKLLEGGHHRIS